jgi:hypothetical protein
MIFIIYNNSFPECTEFGGIECSGALGHGDR